MFRFPLSRLTAVSAALVLLAGLGARAAGPGVIERVSLSTSEAEGFASSYGPLSLSADGRYVAFASSTPFLGSLADFNGASDIFVRDRVAGVTQMISLGNPATPTGQRVLPNSNSARPSITADGRYVAFTSAATNLVTGDTNNFPDVFVRDRLGNVVRASVSTGGTAGDNNSGGHVQISADGQYVVYQSSATNLVAGDTNTVRDVFMTQLDTPIFGGSLTVASTRRLSTDFAGVQGNAESVEPSVSDDGSYVAFASDATNLVAGDTNGFRDVFVKNTFTGEVVRVSVDSFGDEGDGDSTHPYISADGRFVVFVSDAETLDPSDTNGFRDVFVHDRDADGDLIFDETDETSTVRVSVSDLGDEGDDNSGAENATIPTSTIFPDPDSAQPSISADGRYVTFLSDATNLSADPDNNLVTDVFIHDRDADEDGFFDDDDGITTERISVDGSGVEADAVSSFTAISADGNVVVFQSTATNLVFDDTNGVSDIFAWVVEAGGVTNDPPDVIIADDDQRVFEGDTVVLDASQTTDFDGDLLTYSWRQVTDDPTRRVVLSDPTSSAPTFIAPLVADFEELEFELTVSDGVNDPVTATALVSVGPAIPATVTGRVVDASGNAITGAEIRVIRVDGEEATSEVTDGDGYFVVDDVRVGTNTIMASAPGYEPVQRDITVDAGEEVDVQLSLINFTATFTGSVLLSNGEPLVDAVVHFVDRFGNTLDEDTTDSIGEFNLGDLSRFDIAAAVAIEIVKPGYLKWIDANARIPEGATTVRDYRYGRLQVTVDGSPRRVRKQLDGTIVRLMNLQDEDGEIPENEVDRKTRKLNFPNVPAGPVRVRVTNPALTGVEVTATVRPGTVITKVKAVLRPRGVF
jgi:Tol biopolymer transport system component